MTGRVNGALYGCFFATGAAGLVLEVLWTRWLTLVFGATALAVATVLCAFMAGLALGSLLFGRIADRVRRPALVYALCEGGAGLAALAVPIALRAYPALNGLLHRTLGESAAGLALGRFAATFLLLLVPTTLMGGTLPLLARHFVRRAEDVPRAGLTVAGLYAANTAGAVVGAFSSAFVLLPLLGVRRSAEAAALCDLAVGLLVALLLRWQSRRPLPLEPTAPELALTVPTPIPPAQTTAIGRRLALVALGLSGSAAMVYETLWTRALAMVIGSSIYSFALILVVFLSGLALGAAALARFAARTIHPLRALAVAQLGVAGGAILGSLALCHLPAIFLFAIRGGIAPSAVLPLQLLLVTIPILPPTIALGTLLPLTVRACATDGAGVGGEVGRLYAANTFGAIVGSFAGGFLVLPLVGLRGGLALCTLTSLAIGAGLALVSSAPRRQRLACGAMAALLAGAAFLPRWNLHDLTEGVFRLRLAREVANGRASYDGQVVYYHDGLSTTVSVERHGDNLALKNNGKVEASNHADMPTQIMVGLLPVLLWPGQGLPRRAALVGFGSGVTVGAIAQTPGLELDVIELERAVVEASRYFDFWNHAASRLPNVHLHAEDGRNFLALPGPPYDVIVSEPSNPWITGVANLFTYEYFAAVRRRLAPGGVFCAWAQLYELSPLRVKSVYRTLAEVFPYVYVFAAEDVSSDTILIASLAPLSLDLGRLQKRLAIAAIGKELARAGVAGPEDIAGYLLLDPEEIAAFTAGAAENTDDDVYVELWAPRDLLSVSHLTYLDTVYGGGWPYGHLLPVLAPPPDDGGQRFAALASALLRHGKVEQADLLARKALAAGAAPAARQVLDLLPLLAGDSVAEVPPLFPIAPPGVAISATIAAGDRPAYLADLALAWRKAGEGEADDARALLARWPVSLRAKAGPDTQLVEGFIDYAGERNRDAADRLAPLVELAPFVAARPALLYYYGRAAYESGDFTAGISSLTRYLGNAPSSPPRLRPAPRDRG